MHQHVRFRIAALLAFACALAPSPSPAADAEPGSAVLYQIFLTDGSALASYGEFARVGDRVVFSLPIGDEPGGPLLHLVSIPESDVDWSMTDQYTEAARYAHYAAGRGEEDFAVLNAELAQLLNALALTQEPAARLELAESARRALNEWPGARHGYRAEDVWQIGALLDEIVSDLRATAGLQRFDLGFVAFAPPRMPLLPPPTLQQSIEQALRAARATPEPTERVSLLRVVTGLIDRVMDRLPAAWVNVVRAGARAELAAELEVERAYADLLATMLARAAERAARADVRGVEAVIRQIHERDGGLGGRRPRELRALLAAVEEQLDAARRLRLARDRWTGQVGTYRTYRREIAEPIQQLERVQPLLDDIRALAGPGAARLADLDGRLQRASRRWTEVQPPGDLEALHEMLGSALNLAASAGRFRQQAIQRGDLRLAWDASSAAAGALMLFGRMREDLDRHLRPPELQ